MIRIEKKENKRVSFTTTISPSTREELLLFVTVSRGKVRGANDVIEYLIKKYLPITTAQDIVNYIDEMIEPQFPEKIISNKKDKNKRKGEENIEEKQNQANIKAMFSELL